MKGMILLRTIHSVLFTVVSGFIYLLLSIMKFTINEHKRLTMNGDIYNREHYFWSYIFLVVETNVHPSNYDSLYSSEMSSTNILLGSSFLDRISDIIPCDECAENLLKHKRDLKETAYNKESLSVKEQYELLAEIFYRSGALRRKGKNLRTSIQTFVRNYVTFDPYYNPITLAFVEFLWHKEYEDHHIASVLDDQAAHKQTRFTTYGDYIKKYNEVVPSNVLPFDQGDQVAFDSLYSYGKKEG